MDVKIYTICQVLVLAGTTENVIKIPGFLAMIYYDFARRYF